MIGKILCFLGLHDSREVYDTEKEKWKNGRRPLRISMGGFTSYKCSRCGKKWSKTWDAFE